VRKTSKPRLRKSGVSVSAFDELRGIAFATQKADKKSEKKTLARSKTRAGVEAERSPRNTWVFLARQTVMFYGQTLWS
jgi:hypothetical protein